MNEKFFQLFGIKVNFFNSFAFAFTLNFINTLILILFFDLKEHEGFTLVLIILLVETALYLGWRYYRTKHLK